MIEFAYNNVKNASIGHTPFKLNCGHHLQVFFKDNLDFCSRSYSANELVKKTNKSDKYLLTKFILRSKTLEKSKW